MQQRRRRPGYRYWFPARQFGWGWGVPKTWQGWMVLDAYLGVFIVSLFILLFGGSRNLIYGIVGMVGGTAALVWVCYKKGEPLRARLGR